MDQIRQEQQKHKKKSCNLKQKLGIINKDLNNINIIYNPTKPSVCKGQNKMNKQMQQIKQMQLKFKNKIIELQKQLQFQSLRASEYEAKFKQAVMDNSSKNGDEQLLAKIIQNQSEINSLRKQLLHANRKLNDSANNQNVEQLIKQNTQMRNVVEELKNAAIAAIMEKDAEIQQIKRNFNQIDIAHQLSQLQIKNIELQNTIKTRTIQYEQQIKRLNEKLSSQRDGFSDKLTQLQRQASLHENQKDKLLEKAQNLEGNLQNLQKVIQKYENKIQQNQMIRSSQKIQHTKTQYEQQRKIQGLLQDIKLLQKNQNLFQQNILNLNKIIEEQKKKIQGLNEQKQQLDRKLKIKNRKNNLKQNSNSKSILQSFEGFSQKADVYASFVKKQHRDITKQSFIGQPVKLSDIKEIQIQEIQNFSQYIKDYEQTKIASRKNSENFDELKNNNANLKSQLQNQANTITSKNQKIHQLQAKIQSLLNQIEQYNKKMNDLTKQIQKQRQDKLQLKKKHATAQSEYKVQKQSLRLHIYKLQNALLIEKLQTAQKMQSNKQIRQYEKKVYEDQIKKLNTEIQNSKKKKGFFS